VIALVSSDFVVVGKEYGGKSGEVEVRGVSCIRERGGRRRWSGGQEPGDRLPSLTVFNGILHLTTIFSKKLYFYFQKETFFK